MFRVVLPLTPVASLAQPQVPAAPASPGPWTERVAPFKVMGNIHYVGTLDLASFLITSPQGHVLIDSGVEANADAILANIKTLGFEVKDIRVMLTTQGHY